MKRKNNRITFIELPVRTRYARVKGKKFFPVTFTLTQEQIDWLATKPNASELLRKILQDLIDASKDVEKDLGVISLQRQIEELEAEKRKLFKERKTFIEKDIFPDGKSLWNAYGANMVNAINHFDAMPDTLVPESPDVQVAFKILEKYIETANKIDAEINKLKNDILQS